MPSIGPVLKYKNCIPLFYNNFIDLKFKYHGVHSFYECALKMSVHSFLVFSQSIATTSTV